MSTSSPVILYGIPNCDTVKKARAFLAVQGVDYRFHDFRKQGVPPDRVDAWIDAVGWEKVINRQGNTWRKLDANVQAGVTDPPGAKAVALEHASVIKRPVVEWDDGAITVGFDAAAWGARIKTA